MGDFVGVNAPVERHPMFRKGDYPLRKHRMSTRSLKHSLEQTVESTHQLTYRCVTVQIWKHMVHLLLLRSEIIMILILMADKV